MFKNKPVTILIASALLILLVVATGLFQFVFSSNPTGMSGNRPDGFQAGSMPQGDQPQFNGTPPADGSMRSGGAQPGGEGFQPGSMPSDGSNLQGFPGGGGRGDSASAKLMQLWRGVQIGAAILIMLLGVLSIVGMLCGKKWSRTWAIVTCVLVFLAVIPSLFAMMMGLSLVGTVVKIVLAAAVFVLCLLPKSRQPVVVEPAA